MASSSINSVVDIVTGGSQGVGRAIAEFIASQRSAHPPAHNYSLVLVGRNVHRSEQAAKEISESSGVQVIAETCDVSDYNQVKQLQERIEKRMDADFRVGVLVNNAAECPPMLELVTRPQTQSDGSVKETQVEKQFATNVLGYHFMIRIFKDNFLRSPDDPQNRTHIVNIASNWAGGLDLGDLHYRRRTYDNDTAYRQSKQCDRMLTAVWASRFGKEVVVNACHPGDPCTALSKALGYNLFSAPPTAKMIDEDTPITFLCGFKGAVDVTGGWYEGTTRVPRRCSFSGMTNDAERLFEICDSFCVHE